MRHRLDEDVCGKPLARLLQPDAEDYFVLKPKHSGFYSTTLEALLQALGVHTLILTGIAGNICVLFTANDAYMRGYLLCIPADCVASQTVRENASALRLMQTVLKADIVRPRPSTYRTCWPLPTRREEAQWRARSETNCCTCRCKSCRRISHLAP